MIFFHFFFNPKSQKFCGFADIYTEQPRVSCRISHEYEKDKLSHSHSQPFCATHSWSFCICDVPPRKCPYASNENFIGDQIQGRAINERNGRKAQPTKITRSSSNTIAVASACILARNTDVARVRGFVSGERCFYGTRVLIENMLFGMTYQALQYFFYFTFNFQDVLRTGIINLNKIHKSKNNHP